MKNETKNMLCGAAITAWKSVLWVLSLMLYVVFGLTKRYK